MYLSVYIPCYFKGSSLVLLADLFLLSTSETPFIFVQHFWLVCMCGNIKTLVIVAYPGLRLFLMGNLQWRCSDSISIWDYWTLSFTGLYLTVDNQLLVSWLAIKKHAIWYMWCKHTGVPHMRTHARTCVPTVMWWYCNLAGCEFEMFSLFCCLFWKGTWSLGCM